MIYLNLLLSVTTRQIIIHHIAHSSATTSLDSARRQLARPEQSLTSFEDHAVVDFKQLVDKEPRTVRRTFVPVAIFQDPIPVNVLNRALQTTQLIIVEFNVAGWHATNKNLLIALKGEHLVKFRSINKLQLDSVICRSATLINFSVCSAASIFTLEKVYSQM